MLIQPEAALRVLQSAISCTACTSSGCSQTGIRGAGWLAWIRCLAAGPPPRYPARIGASAYFIAVRSHSLFAHWDIEIQHIVPFAWETVFAEPPSLNR